MGSTAMATAEIVAKDLLQCAICLGQLRQPRSLPCLHSFCEVCLGTHISKRNVFQLNKFTFTCPTCREPTQLPKRGVSGFQKDFKANQIVEAFSRMRQERNVLVCEICSDIAAREVTMYCTDCRKNLCENCCAQHKSIPALLEHFLVSTVEPPNGDHIACEVHKEEKCSFFCETCDSAVCLLCVTGDHQRHKTLDLDLSTRRRSSDMQNCLDDLTTKIKETREHLARLSEVESCIKSFYEESRVEMRKKSKIWTQKSEDESRRVSELSHNYQEKRNAVGREKNRFLSCCKDLQKLKNKLEHTLQIQSPSYMGTTYNFVTKELQNLGWINRIIGDQKKTLDRCRSEDFRKWPVEFLSKQDNCCERGNDISEPNFLPLFNKHPQQDNCRVISEPAQKLNFQNITRVTSGPTTVINCGMSKLSSIENCSPKMFFENTIKNMSPILSYLGRIDSVVVRPLFRLGGLDSSLQGKLTLPYNLCFTTDGMLAIAENGTSRLQVFDGDGKVERLIEVGDSIPRSVTALDNNGLAFTDERAKTIKIYVGDNEPLKTIDFRQLAFPYAITAISNGGLVVSDMIHENIKIISPHGNIEFEFGGYGKSGMDKFNNPAYLAARDSHIFVSDSGNHEVKVFKECGIFMFKFGRYGSGNGQLKYPKGIALHKDGHVFVSDFGNNRIVMFSSSGIAMGTILGEADGIIRPSGLAYSPSGRLAVTMPDLHEVRVYELTITVSA